MIVEGLKRYKHKIPSKDVKKTVVKKFHGRPRRNVPWISKKQRQKSSVWAWKVSNYFVKAQHRQTSHEKFGKLAITAPDENRGENGRSRVQTKYPVKTSKWRNWLCLKVKIIELFRENGRIPLDSPGEIFKVQTKFPVKTSKNAKMALFESEIISWKWKVSRHKFPWKRDNGEKEERSPLQNEYFRDTFVKMVLIWRKWRRKGLRLTVKMSNYFVKLVLIWRKIKNWR